MGRDSEDRETRQPPSNAENPFIKFRQFADEQISSLLQGIIGLPSAFSKTPASTRWAIFEDELRMQENLQAKKMELMEMERRNAETRQTGQEEDAEIPVKKFPGWTKQSSMTSEELANNTKMDDQTTRDLPLYSPVSKSLFNHFRHTGLVDGESNWSPIRSIFYNNPFQAFPDHMTAVQYSVLSDLAQTPRFRSDYSLVPYLLFSPYSPLRLSSDAIFGSLRRDIRIHDSFPYCDAFEDLILLTQGRPMATHHSPITRALTSPGLFVPLSFEWIHRLYSVGLLQQKEERMEEVITSRSMLGHGGFFQPFKNTNPEKNQSSPQTEEEMYERFLQLASANIETSGLGILASIFADIEKEFENPKSEYGQTFRRIAEQIKATKLDEEGDVAPLVESLLKSMVKADVKDIQDRQTRETPKATQDPDKVVATSTTTIDTTNEDGSVKTSIMVRKRFADGRETVTTTEHTEDPARDEHGNLVPRYTSDTTQNASKQEEKKENGKKGWFWN